MVFQSVYTLLCICCRSVCAFAKCRVVKKCGYFSLFCADLRFYRFNDLRSTYPHGSHVAKLSTYISHTEANHIWLHVCTSRYVQLNMEVRILVQRIIFLLSFMEDSENELWNFPSLELSLLLLP